MYTKKFKSILPDYLEIQYDKFLKNIDEDYNLDINTFDIIQHDKEFFDFLFLNSNEKKLTILDIGANLGKFALYCAPIAKNIYSIEPTSILCSEMKIFLKDFKNISIHNCAISSQTGLRDFYYFYDAIGVSSLHNLSKRNKHDSLKFKVQAYTIFDFIMKYKIEYVDICKVDIEGEEVNIFNDNMLSELKPYIDRFWVEVHHTNHINKKSADENLIDLINIFKKNNYKIYKQKNHWSFIAYL